ncbi:uncharacterized protein [Drosophila kikkawai]|uniref:Uncharacterized protein n=1 Tax=Drosophila kikkawai TaxID=30033 RepID=A0ABM4GH68_DROKI
MVQRSAVPASRSEWIPWPLPDFLDLRRVLLLVWFRSSHLANPVPFSCRIARRWRRERCTAPPSKAALDLDALLPQLINGEQLHRVNEPRYSLSQPLLHHLYQMPLWHWLFQACRKGLHGVQVVVDGLSWLLLPLQQQVHPLVLRFVALEPVQQRPTQLAPTVQPVLLNVDPVPLQRPARQQGVEVTQNFSPRATSLALEVLQTKHESFDVVPLVLAAERDVPPVHSGVLGTASRVPVGVRPLVPELSGSAILHAPAPASAVIPRPLFRLSGPSWAAAGQLQWIRRPPWRLRWHTWRCPCRLPTGRLLASRYGSTSALGSLRRSSPRKRLLWSCFWERLLSWCFWKRLLFLLGWCPQRLLWEARPQLFSQPLTYSRLLGLAVCLRCLCQCEVHRRLDRRVYWWILKMYRLRSGIHLQQLVSCCPDRLELQQLPLVRLLWLFCCPSSRWRPRQPH